MRVNLIVTISSQCIWRLLPPALKIPVCNLNIHNFLCQSYLNKAGGKKKNTHTNFRKDKVPPLAVNTKACTVPCLLTSEKSPNNPHSCSSCLFIVPNTFRYFYRIRDLSIPHFNESGIQTAMVSSLWSVRTVQGTKHSMFSVSPFPKFPRKSSGNPGSCPCSWGVTWINQHKPQRFQWRSILTMQTAGRKRSAGCDLFSAASPLVKSENKACAIFTLRRNREHMRTFSFSSLNSSGSWFKSYFAFD